MLNGTYYLNNHGSRCVHYTNGKKEQIKLKVNGVFVGMRTVIFQEAFGNFAVYCISYKSKKYKLFPERDDDGTTYVNLQSKFYPEVV